MVLVQQFWEEVFNKGNLDPIPELIGPGYTFNDEPQTPAEVAAWVTSLRTEFPDMHFTIEDILQAGDKVAIRWTMTGTDTKTGTKMTTSGTNIILVVDGKALSNWQNGGTPADLHPVG